MDNDLVNDIDMVEEERYINIKGNDDTTIETIEEREEQKMTPFCKDIERERKEAEEAEKARQIAWNAMIENKTNCIEYNGITYTASMEEVNKEIERQNIQKANETGGTILAILLSILIGFIVCNTVDIWGTIIIWLVGGSLMLIPIAMIIFTGACVLAIICAIISSIFKK